MRQAQGDAKKEIEEYKAMREAKLRSVQPEVRRGGAHIIRGADALFAIDARRGLSEERVVASGPHAAARAA
jgi:hypothetical protein